jgi:hypothetical protein
VTQTVHCPVTVHRQVAETHPVCVPKQVCSQVPVEVCVKVPVVVHCPAAVVPSAQCVVASPQAAVPATTFPSCETCDSRHPLIARKSLPY